MSQCLLCYHSLWMKVMLWYIIFVGIDRKLTHFHWRTGEMGVGCHHEPPKCSPPRKNREEGHAESNYLMTVSRGFTSTENGYPSFDCYSEPNAVISTGRYVYTRNAGDLLGPSNPSPPDPEVLSSGDHQTTDIYHTDLRPLQPYGSYGVFYCESSEDGIRTVVPTIFLRSDAYFIPSEGRFTQTVTAGQVNVSIQFDRIYRSNEPLNIWRFNGTDDGYDYFLRSPDITYIINDTIQESQKGVYEIHVIGIRYQSRGGLMRIIVRDCPLGRYNSSSDCEMTCSSCYNGGICDETGQCICAPGFMGDTCQDACGPNRLGRSCEYRCNASVDDETACRGVQICLPDPYGCSCATGYTDLSCTTECDVGKFGASCSETCHCVSGECDRFTGVCTGSLTDCQPGWTGTNCQHCTAGRFGQNCSGTIKIENIAKNEGQPDIGFNCRRDSEEGEHLSSAQPVVRLYRVTDDQGRLSDEGITRIGDLQQESTTIDFFEVDQVAADDLFVCIIYDVDNYRSDVVRADLNILPQLRGQPSILEATQTSITLSWIEWRAGVDIGDPPVIGYNVYYKEAVSPTWIRVDRRNPLDVSEFIDGLDPDSDYLFAVSVVREGDGGEGPLTSFSARTACLPPSGVVSYVTAHQVSSADELLITWLPLVCSVASANCRSGFTNISIYFSSMNDDSTQGQVQIPFNDTTGSYYLDSLEPETGYSVYITLWNKDSEGPPSDASSGMTDEEQTAICNSASGSLVPWVLFGIAFFVAVVSIIASVFLWRRSCKTNSDSEPPKASSTESVKEESTYENPVFDEPPVKQYESLDAITTDDDYMRPEAS